MAVKQKYSSEVRAAQARETRQAVIAAAVRLFVELGYGATSMDAIAESAEVSRKTVFNAVGGKLDLLRVALEQAVVGDDRPVPLLDRPEVSHLRDVTDPHDILREWASLTTTISSRLAALSIVLSVAAGIDPDAKVLRAEATAQRHAGQHAFVTYLHSIEALRDDLDLHKAADIAWLYSDPQVYQRLVNERQWTPPQFEDWLVRTMSAELLPLAG